MKAYDPDAKLGALRLWTTFSLLWVGVMASPLYFLKEKLAARSDYLILLPLLSLSATWTWVKFAVGVGRRIKDAPVEPTS